MYTLKDYYYDLNKSSELGTDIYLHVQKLSPYLHASKFTLSDCQRHIPDLTYRKINDWDRKNLITGSRTNKQAGWRKFSTIDIIKLFIISDLRKFGVQIKNIKSVLSNICTSFAEKETRNYRKTKFLQLEFFISRSLLKDPILLLIGEDQSVLFFQKKEAIKYHFYFDKAKDPMLILPFFLYVEKIYNALKRKI